jgi:hypothetical protein
VSYNLSLQEPLLQTLNKLSKWHWSSEPKCSIPYTLSMDLRWTISRLVQNATDWMTTKRLKLWPCPTKWNSNSSSKPNKSLKNYSQKTRKQ